MKEDSIPSKSPINFPRWKPAPLDPDMKAFLDEVIIPSLIKEALAGIRDQGIECDRSTEVA